MNLPKMEVYVFVLLFATVVAFQSQPSQSVSSRFNEHAKRVAEFCCKEPQKRAIPVSSLANLPSNEKYFPEVTVLHRCDSSTGRCPQGEGFACGPSTVETVDLVFHAESILLGGNKRKNKKRYEIIQALNHTLCECQRVTELPK